MERLTTIRADTTTIAGRRLLRYTATIVNVGDGPFEARGTRPDTSTTTMSVVQRVYDDAGGYQDIAAGSDMFWAGDGHNHWHLRDLEGGVLTRLDNGVQVGTSAKHGFRFWDGGVFDLSLPGAPRSAQYLSCGDACKIDVLDDVMGLSVGWADTYSAGTAYQWIDITGLKGGKYKLTAMADPSQYFSETDNSNNSASATLLITKNQVRILGYSGGA